MTFPKWLSLGSFLAAMLAAPLVGQPFARQFSVSFGAGGAIPREDLASFMNTSGMLNIGFGYRPVKYFQADVGLIPVFHAANVRDFQDTIIGRLKIRDNEFMVPIGARGILPIGPRVEVFGGGGAAYLYYGESVEVPGAGSDSGFRCQVCRSRGGWGYYTAAGVNIAVERSHRFWIGVESRLIHGKTNGDPLGAVPPLETTDTWVNTSAVFTVRFP